MDLRVSNPKSPAVIDGFASVQAVRRAVSRTRDPKPASPSPVESAPEESAEAKPAGRFSRTALPDKFEVVCYECGYTFPLTGRIKNTLCPRCRATLEKKDLRLGPDSPEQVKTIGTVNVPAGAKLPKMAIAAHDVIVAGDATLAAISCQVLCLQTHASIDVARVKTRDLRIDPAQVVSLPHPLTCQNLDVHGELDAHVSIAGRLHIHPGGHLKGQVRTPHLQVEEGGGLTATLDVGPQASVEWLPAVAPTVSPPAEKARPSPVSKPRPPANPATGARPAARRKPKNSNPGTTRK